MNATSLEHKTIRPGSLAGYSYYHSNRRPAVARPNYTAGSRIKLASKHKTAIKALMIVAVVGLGFVWLRPGSDAALVQQAQSAQGTAASTAATAQPPTETTAPDKAAAVLPATTTNRCASNTLDKLVLVSVNQRHLWACEGSKIVHDTPVITGMLNHPSTTTPPGTYQVYAKTTDTTLTGSDEAGSWNRHVHYWLPFLDNEHGTYGFHDATWRPDSEFGAIDPNTDQASHGCVELPLASMEWLYHWAPTHTTLTVES